jgi:hypothetical protein
MIVLDSIYDNRKKKQRATVQEDRIYVPGYHDAGMIISKSGYKK